VIRLFFASCRMTYSDGLNIGDNHEIPNSQFQRLESGNSIFFLASMAPLKSTLFILSTTRKATCSLHRRPGCHLPEKLTSYSGFIHRGLQAHLVKVLTRGDGLLKIVIRLEVRSTAYRPSARSDPELRMAVKRGSRSISILHGDLGLHYCLVIFIDDLM